MAQSIRSMEQYDFERWRTGNVRLVDRWVANGLLEDIDPDKAEDIVGNGAMVFACSDHTQIMEDVFPHLVEWFLTKDFHVYADHGGGLLVDPEFPYNRQVRDMSAHWTDRASEAYLDMGIWHVLLMGHVPCKQQRQYRYSAVDMVRSLIRAKDHLKIELTKRAKERAEKHEVPMPPKLKVGILIQVDRGVGCRGRKRRVTRLLPARNFRNIVGIHRPDFVNAVC